MDCKDFSTAKTAIEGALDFADKASEGGEAYAVNDFELKLEICWKNSGGDAVLTATVAIKAEPYIPF